MVDVQTDIAQREASFKLTKLDVDYESKLAELAEDNSHLAEYKIASTEQF